MAVKRVLIFSLAYYPDLVGGAEVSVREITDRFAPTEYEFHMITLRSDLSSPLAERIGNVYVRRIGSGKMGRFDKYFYLFSAARLGIRLHKIERFDIVWSIMSYVAGFPGLFFKFFNKHVPFLLTLQEGDPIDYILRKTKPVSGLYRKIFMKADRIQAISHYLAQFGRSMGASCETVVIPNGVDIGKFAREISPRELDEVKEEIGKSPGDVFLVTASRLVGKNAVDVCISALLNLPPHVKLLVIGKGRLETALKKQTGRLDLGKRVVFKGYVGHDELPKYLKACDVFVRPSRSEGFGNSFIEAMAAGVPVIATREGGIPDFLTDNVTGLFCDTDSPEDLARKTSLYLKDGALRAKIVANALSMVRERYDWGKIAADMKERAFDPLVMPR